MKYCASICCMDLFSPMKSVWHNYTIHLQISTSSVLTDYAFCRCLTTFVGVVAMGMRNNRRLLRRRLHQLSLCKWLLKVSACWLRLCVRWPTVMITMLARDPSQINTVASRTSRIPNLLSLERQKNRFKLMSGRTP
jgi:hypothetical protein